MLFIDSMQFMNSSLFLLMKSYRKKDNLIYTTDI